MFEEELLCSAELVDRIEVCIGEEIQFTDQSFFGPGVVLDFGDGTVLAGSVDSLHRNPIYQYAEAGEFEVYLTVSNANGAITSLDPVVITVMDNGMLPAAWQESFEAGVGPWADDQWDVQALSGYPWQIRSTTGYSGARSLYVRNRNNESGDITPDHQFDLQCGGHGGRDDRLQIRLPRDRGNGRSPEAAGQPGLWRDVEHLSIPPRPHRSGHGADHGGNLSVQTRRVGFYDIEEVDNELYMVPNSECGSSSSPRAATTSSWMTSTCTAWIRWAMWSVWTRSSMLSSPRWWPSPNPSWGTVTVRAMWSGGDAGCFSGMQQAD